MANGRLGRPEEAIDVALGCLLLRKTSSTPAVVPGAAPALAKAGVGGYIYIYVILCYIIIYIYIPTLSWRSLALQSDGPGLFPGFIKLRLNLDLDSRWSSNKNW